MAINLDKPSRWNSDTLASVDQFNQWFIEFAPDAYRKSRVSTTESVRQTLLATRDLATVTPDLLRSNPKILSTLRMTTCPPLARDRLIGLANVGRNFVECLEKGQVPDRMASSLIASNLDRITLILSKLLDVDIFPWLKDHRLPTEEERYRSSTIVADRLCGAVADPIVRNAQEKRQLMLIDEYLTQRGYIKKSLAPNMKLTDMPPGTFSFRVKVVTWHDQSKSRSVNIPIDVVIQPIKATIPSLPILVEAKSAGDYTNVNKRRKEEAQKMQFLKATYGEEIKFILFLCGYFDAGYLGFEAAAGIDWVWEHRISDLENLGI